MQKVHIRFPGISCCVCGEGLQGQEACIHPTQRGPQGGKKYCHEHCLDGAEAYGNPFMGHNPFGHENAGRRTHKGVQKEGRLPRNAPSASPEMSKMTKEELVLRGDSQAIAELSRRGRGADGVKLAWKVTAKTVKTAANNPYGFDEYEF